MKHLRRIAKGIVGLLCVGVGIFLFARLLIFAAEYPRTIGILLLAIAFLGLVYWVGLFIEI